MLTQATPPLLRIEDLSIAFDTDDGVAEVLDRVDLTVDNGHVVGVVGESGCGKSTLVGDPRDLTRSRTGSKRSNLVRLDEYSDLKPTPIDQRRAGEEAWLYPPRPISGT